jgi:hypothetical protein
MGYLRRSGPWVLAVVFGLPFAVPVLGEGAAPTPSGIMSGCLALFFAAVGVARLRARRQDVGGRRE